MRGEIQDIERGVEAGAAAVLGAAVAYCPWRLLELPLAPSALALLFAGLGGGAFLVCRRILGRIDAPVRSFRLSPFTVAPFEPQAPFGELLLDDVLPPPAPDSRVVRLFGPAARPTPGELKARIDRHLAASPAPDASHALYTALAELRSELR